MFRHSFFAIIGSASIGILIVSSACSPPSYEGTVKKSSRDGSAEGATTTSDTTSSEWWWDAGEDDFGSSPSSEDGDGGESAGEGSSCAATASQSLCTTCCDKQNFEGRRFFNQQKDACFCEAQADGRCVADCKDTYCAGRVIEPRSVCADCLSTNDDACFNRALAACQKDKGCSAMLLCNEASKCAGKPR